MKTRRFLSVLLSLAMVFSLLAPTAAFAADTGDDAMVLGTVTGGSFTDDTANADESYEYTITGSDGSVAKITVLADEEGNTDTDTDTDSVIEHIDGYVRITSMDDLTDGTYVIAGARSGYNLNKAILSDTNYSANDLTVSDGVITSEIDETYQWRITVVEGGYTIQNSDGQYLYICNYNSAVQDAVQTRTDEYIMTIVAAVDNQGTGVATGSFNIGGLSTSENQMGYLNHRADGYIGTWYSRDIGSCIYLYKYTSEYKVTSTAIAAAIAGVKNRLYYTSESYKAFTGKLAAARKVYDTEAEATAAYDALLAAITGLEQSDVEAVTFNTSNNNISWSRTADTSGNYVSNIPYLNNNGTHTYNDVEYSQYTALTWEWSSLNKLIGDQDTKVYEVWSTQSDGLSACKFSENSADEWYDENFYKISGTFEWPEEYDLNDTTISIASVNDVYYSGIYDYIKDHSLSDYFDGNVIPINDDVYVVMWVEDSETNVTSDNINDYLMFWTGTSGKGKWTQNGNTSADWNRGTPATFLSAMKQGVRAFRASWPNAVGVVDGKGNTDVETDSDGLTGSPQKYTGGTGSDLNYTVHTDGWYTITDTSSINSVMRNKYSSIDAGSIVHLDLYVANNDGEGIIDELEVTLSKKKVTEADVTVKYYYNNVSDDTYLGSSVMTNQTIGSEITLTGGTNASQLDYMKSAAIAATKKNMYSGVQLNTITVQKDSSQNIINVLYTATTDQVIYLTAATNSYDYTGNSITLNEVTVSEVGYEGTGTTTNGTYTLPDGNTLKNAISVVTETNPGIYENNFKDASGNPLTYVVENSAGQQITDTYTILTIPGTLTITYDPDPVSYTYDFGVTNYYEDVLAGKNNIERSAVVTVPESVAEYAEFDMENYTVTYTPQSVNTGDSVDLTLTFTGNYQVTKTVTFVPASNVLYEENMVTPAYDEDGNSDWTLVGDDKNEIDSSVLPVVDDNNSTVYGYTDINEYAESVGFSNGSAYQADLTLAGATTTRTNEAATFTFTGTGFDLISECGTDTGMLLVKVSDSNGIAKKAYLVDTYFTGDSGDDETKPIISGEGILDYQVPVVRNLTLDYDTYTVTVYGYLVNTAGAVGAAAAASYGLTEDEFGGAESDTGSGVSAEDIVIAALDDLDLWDELDVEDVEVSFMSEDSVLNGGYGNTAAAGASSAAVMAYAARATEDETASGESVTAHVYIDGFRVYKPLDNDAYYSSEESDVVYASVYDFVKNSVTELEEDQLLDNACVYVEYDGETGVAAIADYKSQGPQNEVYLTPGSGIAFALGEYNEGDTVQLGIKCVGEDCFASNIEMEEPNDPTFTEMYYTITPTYDDINEYWYVVVTNDPDATSILALSGLKISSNIVPWASGELGEKVIKELEKTDGAEFTPNLLTASASASVKSGRNLTISVQSSVGDVDHVVIVREDEAEEHQLTATNTRLVEAGRSDVYKYSYTFRTKGLEVRAYTFYVYAYNEAGDCSAPVTITITVT